VQGFEGIIGRHDRKILRRYIAALMTEGLIERVAVPSEIEGKVHYCIRLTEFRPKGQETFAGERIPGGSMSQAKPGESLEEDDDADVEDPLAVNQSQHYITFDHTVSKEYSVIESIKQAGIKGILFEKLYTDLPFDKKTIQGICYKFASLGVNFPHLSDYGLFETTQREQRLNKVRWFAAREYIAHCAQINVDPLISPEYLEALKHVGEFRDISRQSFYSSNEVYHAKLREAHSNTKLMRADAVKKRKGREDVPYFRGRPRKFIKVLDLDRNILKRSKATELKTSPLIPEPLLFNKANKMLYPMPKELVDGTGRVPEPQDWNDPTGGTNGKLKAYWVAIAAGEEPPTNPTESDVEALRQHRIKGEKKRGRPRKIVAEDADGSTQIKKKRGRPRKAVAEAAEESAANGNGEPSVESTAEEPPKKKGRVAKAKPAPKASAKAPPRATRGRKADEAHKDEVKLAEPSEAASQPMPKPSDLASLEALEDQHEGSADIEQEPDVAGSYTTAIPESTLETPIASIAAGNSTGNANVGMVVDPVLASPSVPPAMETQDAPVPVDPPVSASLHHQASTSVASPKTPVRPKASRKAPSDPIPAKPPKRVRIDHDLEMQLREVLRFISEQGGIVQGKHSLTSSLENWCKTATYGGQFPEQALQGKVDGRRINKLTDMLEDSGRIRRTTVASDGNREKTFVVIWLPDTPEERVLDYIMELRHAGAPRVLSKIEAVPADTIGFSKVSRTPRKPNKPHRGFENVSTLRISTATPEQLHELSPDDMRNAFRQDWRMYPQQYGWEPGLGRRLELFHHILCDAARAHGQLVEDGICVRRNDVLAQLSVTAMCQILPVKDDDETLLEMFRSGEASRKTVGELQGSPATLLSVTSPRIRNKFESLLDHLVKMGLAEPREKILGECDVFRPVTLERSNYVWLAQRGSLIDWTKAKKSSTATKQTAVSFELPLQTSEDVSAFWYLTWYRTMSDGSEQDKLQHVFALLAERGRTYKESVMHLAGLEVLSGYFCRPRAWRKGFVLHEAQQRYLQWLAESRFIPDDPGNQPDFHEETAYRLFAPVEPIKKYLLSRLSHRHKRDHREAKKARSGEAEEALREAIKQKVEERQIRREALWIELLDSACSRVGISSSDELRNYLEAFHRRYLRDPTSFNTTQFFEVVSNHVAALLQKKKPGRAHLVPTVAPVAKTSRIRTHWTTQMEELARDAFVVIEHRRKHVPPDAITKATIASAWAKVFPHVPAYKIRRRTTDWMAESAENAEFIKQLSLQWETILATNKDLPPDIDPSSMEHFDVLMNISSLRQFVKKNAV
jgi:hypothetical protein